MSPVPTVADVRRALARLDPTPPGDSVVGPTAAVAAVLRAGRAAMDLLFIRRAEHPGDPWSGDMGLPGGRVEPGDAGPLGAAVRETLEELALDLERDAALLGALPTVRTHLRRGPGPLWVAPFVFELKGAPPLTPNHEVQEAIWVPLAFLLERGNRSSFSWTGRGAPFEMPCYRFDGRLIWGLTLHMLDDFLATLAASGPNA